VNLREILTLAPLIVMCFWIGLYPKPFFEMTAKSAEKIVIAVNAPAVSESAPRLAAAVPAAPVPAAETAVAGAK
jgi:NADH-quinone oxidoreductase subunit M